MNKKLSSLEAIFVFVTLAINSILLNIPKLLVDSTSTGAFINSLYVGIIALFFFAFITKLLIKFPSSDILDISNYLGGKKLKFLTSLIFILFLSLIIILSISHFVMLLKTIYFIKTPLIFLIFVFLFTIFITNLFGFDSIKKSMCFYLPITFIATLIILKSKINAFSLLKITPILGKNLTTTFFYGTSNIIIFSNFIFLFFLTPYLDNSKKLSKVSLTSFLLTWLLNVLSIVALLTAYPLSNASFDINSFYIITRRIELSDFLQRTDGIFMFIWILSFFSYISFIFYLICSIFSKSFKLKNEKMVSFSVSSIFIGLIYASCTSNFYKFDGINIYKYSFIFIIFIVCFLILFLANLKRKKLL